MPTYVYQCVLCMHRFEQEQKIKDEPLKECPKCGKQSLARLIGKTSFVLKGDGWASTGYASVKKGASK